MAKIDLACDSVRAATGALVTEYIHACMKCRRPVPLCRHDALHQLAGYHVFLALFNRVTHYHTGRTGQLRFIGLYDPERSDWPCIVRYPVKSGGTHDRASASLLSFRPAGRRKPRPDKTIRKSIQKRR
ncbi:MAG: hypothetical protein BGO39_02880 [Chloroflexi bacterium 54-19]|nr:MAG: hypothetical protein BGO39_02880 [Chloroflexi bacterium 54-19]